MNFRRSGGFALPTVLIASIVMLTVLLVAVTSTAAIRVALVSHYYNRLAQTAGDAGAEYAKSCLWANNGKPLWSDSRPLKPDTDCAGNQLASCPVSPATAACHAVLLDSNSNVFTAFTVGLPQLDSNGLAVNVASIGATKLIRSSDLASGVVTAWRQYNQTSNLVIDTTVPAKIYTGVLTYVSSTLIPGGYTGSSITISPDGAWVYVGSNSGLVYTFSRNTSTGVLTYISNITIPGGYTGSSITISPDGAWVYVGSNSGLVYTFSRN